MAKPRISPTRSPPSLGVTVAGRWHEVVQHVPVELAERARTAATEVDADAVVCLGGGSSTGLAKAIALTHELPIVAVPTTYAGSEMTTIYGLTGGRHKQTGTSASVLPKVVVYDPLLTLGLPPNVTAPSAFNALAHSVEALWTTGCNPVTTALALEGVRAIARSLPAVMADGGDVDGRSDLLYGAYLSGIALGTTSAGSAPQAVPRPRRHVQPRSRRRSCSRAPARGGVQRPRPPRRHGTPGRRPRRARRRPGGRPLGPRRGELGGTSLADLGLTAADLPEVAQRAADAIGDNPVPVDVDALLGLLREAFDGTRPAAPPNRWVMRGWHSPLDAQSVSAQPPDFAFQRSRPARARSRRWAGTRAAAADTAASPPPSPPAAAGADSSSGATRSSKAGGCIPGCQ